MTENDTSTTGTEQTIVTDQSDIEDLLKELEVPIHNQWVDVRETSETPGYGPVSLIVEWRLDIGESNRSVNTYSDHDA